MFASSNHQSRRQRRTSAFNFAISDHDSLSTSTNDLNNKKSQILEHVWLLITMAIILSLPILHASPYNAMSPSHPMSLSKRDASSSSLSFASMRYLGTWDPTLSTASIKNMQNCSQTHRIAQNDSCILLSLANSLVS
jgi:hypothetical protein